MGGVPIFIGAIFAILFWMIGTMDFDGKFLLSSLVILFVIGLRDDLIPLKPILKLVSQLIPILLIALFSDFQLTSFYSLIDADFPPLVSILLTTFTLVVITNSFNLIDGIDGLSGSLGCIILSSLGVWFFLLGEYQSASISLAFVGSLIAFLMYNWSPSRIFMGDTGALAIGFLIACFSIQFINVNFELDPSHPLRFESTISTAIFLLILPLTDTLRVFFLRLLYSKSPFAADNNHIHHILIDLGLSHSSASLILGGVNIVFILIAYLGKDVGDKLMLSIVIGLCALLLTLLKILMDRKSKTEKRAVQ